MDLFSAISPPCGECAKLDATPLHSGVRYCHGAKNWRFADERVDCPYREPTDASRRNHERQPGNGSSAPDASQIPGIAK